MKKPGPLFATFALTALGIIAFFAAFGGATRIFRRTLLSWVHRELAARTELAAGSLAEPLATGDFRRVREFAETCRENGERLTVMSGPRGLVFDSLGANVGDEGFIYETRPSGSYSVRLGLPLDRTLEPCRSAGRLFAFAGFASAAAMIVVFLLVYRQRVRIRELKRIERFRGDFVADVSHELKTPLTGITGAVDLLADGDSLPPAARAKLLSMLKHEAVRLNDLAQNILSLARLERRHGAADFAEADVADIVAETVERFAQKAGAAGMKIKTRLPYADSGAVASCIVRCDAQLVSQALANLVENAIRYSGADEIAISLERAEGFVKLAVEDHGAGVPEEHRARLFERFYRVDAARSAETGGSGLGLAIVRSIARLHGGDATFSPVLPSGSRFEISLAAKHSKS